MSTPSLPTTLALFLLCLGPAAAGGQTASTPAQCASDEYRQFDFWVGSWEVRDPQGKLQGTNRIDRIEGGCVLQEHWTGASGGTGTSFNIYDFTTGKWHQTWVSGATLLLLDGGLRDGKMVLEGTTVGRDGATTFNRITWTPVEPGVVTQVWDQSQDGKTWNTVFNGTYRRAT